MAFILSKVLLPLLHPLNWIIIILLWSIFTKVKSRRRQLIILDLVLIYLFSAPVFLDAYARLWDYPQADLPAKNSYSCVIVLGGFSGEKRNKDGYFDIAADRFIQGVELVKIGKAKKILVTSGDGSLNSDGFSEAAWVRGELKKIGVSDSLVLIEGKSRNTIENALFTKKLLDTNNLKPPYLLVTSAFHMRRSVVIFEKAGFQVIPYPANYIAGIGQMRYYSFLPSAENLGRWNAYTKEFAGIIVAKLRNF